MWYAALALTSCSQSFPSKGPGAILDLEVDPAEITVYTTPAGTEPTPFGLTAAHEDGSVDTIPEAEWTLSNSTVGTIDEHGLFTPSTENGGVSYVNARFAGVETHALLTVVYQDEVVGEGIDPAAFNVPRTAHDDLWTYPADGVNLPRNTPSLSFQWAEVGSTAARLRFRSHVTDLTVYTTGTNWTADEETWAKLVGTNAGGSVDVELSLLVGAEVWSEEIITLNVNRFDARGSIYYWSTSASGIRVIPYGGQATDFVTAGTTGYCVGCHTVRKGEIAFTYDGGNGALGVRRISDGAEIVTHDAGIYGNFNTFSPDGTKLLVAFKGALMLYDAQTGAYLQEIPTGGLATHPDWSPDGTRVAFVYRNDGEDWTFSGGRIAVMDVASDGTFGAPYVVYDPPDPYNAYYPAWSPDGDWIAFDVSTGDGYADPDAMVWVVKEDGSVVVELTAANISADLTNSLPRWGPLPDDEVMWLAFSSNRVYGNVTAGNPQLWVAGFDPERAARGEDPSWPAFWLPGQDPTQNNHIPMWAE